MANIAGYHTTKILHEGVNTAVLMAVHPVDGQTLVIKLIKGDHPPIELLERLREEHALLSSLNSPYIIKTLGILPHHNSLALLLEDCHGISLAQTYKDTQPKLLDFLEIGIDIARALEVLHDKGIVYGQLNPLSISLCGPTRKVKLTHFNQATRAQMETKQHHYPVTLETSLWYISPEQTGRVNRGVDHRTDLYSLGVILYQLATGTLPSSGSSPAEIIHHHLAHTPESPNTLNPAIPATLSGIILKLLEKSPVNRYQSCQPLLVDLTRCAQQMENYSTIVDFDLAQDEIPHSLRIPTRLYNRSEDIQALRDALSQATQGSSSSLILKGCSGIGKSSLIHDFQRNLGENEALFFEGKFEKATRNIPYSAISSGSQQLISQILTLSSATVTGWKNSLKKVFGVEGKALTSIVPELELILGSQPSLQPLHPAEQEKRFFDIFRSFLTISSELGLTLIMFFDDLQWADEASLSLLKVIVGDQTLSNIFFIGAYRDTELHNNEALQIFLESLANRENPSLCRSLEHLRQEDIEQILSRTLAHDRKQVADLAQIALEKTGGNPFFLKQFLHSLYRKKIIFFSGETKSWQWDDDAVSSCQLTSNIADHIIQDLSSLPPEVLKMLKTASCLGSRFSTDLLAPIHIKVDRDIQPLLDIAQNNGILLKYFSNQQQNAHLYRFSHDQIHHAIYSLLETSEAGRIHNEIAYWLLTQKDQDYYQQNIFEIADHCNRSQPAHFSLLKWSHIARVNLDAGKKVKNSAAYTAAHQYFQHGLASLPMDCWEKEYQLSLELYVQGSETAYLTGNYGSTKTLFETVCSKSTNLYDTCDAYMVRIRALKAENQLGQALATVIEILELLKISLPKKPGKARIVATIFRTMKRLSRYSEEELLALPEMTDKHSRLIMGFIQEMGTISYYTKPQLLPFINEWAVKLSLKHGNSPESNLMGYTLHGFLLCGASPKLIERGYTLGHLSLKLEQLQRPADDYIQALYLFNNLIRHWKDHVKDTIGPLRTVAVKGKNAGEYEISANAAYSCTYRLYFLGANLADVSKEMEEYQQHIKSLNLQIPLYRQLLFQQATSNLLTPGRDPTILSGRYYNEATHFKHHSKSRDYTTIAQFSLIKLIHGVLFHRHGETAEHGNTVREHLRHLTASLFVPIFYFYDSLARLALHNSLSLKEKYLNRISIHRNQNKLKQWAIHCPVNFSHKHSLVEAERARIFNQTKSAMAYYDRSIEQARTNGYQLEEGLANEIASRFYKEQKRTRIAHFYEREARYCYYRCGAAAKVKELDDRVWSSTGQQQDQEVSLVTENIPLSEVRLGGGGFRLDMMAAIKASRVFNSERVHDELMIKMLRIMLESAGAKKGYLIFKENTAWAIRVTGSIGQPCKVELTDIPLHNTDIVPKTLIHYVIHTTMDLVLNDACNKGLFTNDPYIREKQPKSILAIPIIHQGELLCILYLENNLTTDAFPPDRQELLHLLGAQAAISLKNSRLFEELEQTVTQLNGEIQRRKDAQLQLLHAEKLSALGRVSASIAHEFGNPLMGVRYLLEEFHKRGTISEDDQKLLELGLEECDRMKQLTRDLQQLHKPSSGKRSMVNIHTLLDNVLLFQKKHFTTNQIHVIKHYDNAIPAVEVIEDQVTQILMNLTMNAVDAMDDGGGTLTLSTCIEEQLLRLDVTDTGTGIPYEYQERIFEPFFSTKTEEDGTGLGLSISYGIAQHHGGQLQFSSNPGQGTTFTLTLPLLN